MRIVDDFLRHRGDQFGRVLAMGFRGIADLFRSVADDFDGHRLSQHIGVATNQAGNFVAAQPGNRIFRQGGWKLSIPVGLNGADAYRKWRMSCEQSSNTAADAVRKVHMADLGGAAGFRCGSRRSPSRFV